MREADMLTACLPLLVDIVSVCIMKNILFLIGIFCAVYTQAQTLAFPGAEGYGKYTVGGRGGKVFVVTNLKDSGKGSLREAVEAKGPRTVVFAVDGTIELKTPLRINHDSITIAGQSAPGDGICLKNCPLVVNASEVIVRYIRVRMGDRYKADSDALGGGRYGQHHVILDHLSVSWSIDECLSIYKTQNLTVQWCLVSHSLHRSLHTKGSHGFGGIWGGCMATFHHNLLANHASRNPRFSSVDGTKWVDFRNNVVYNWGFKSAYGGGRHGEINLVSNYYKPGPASEHHRLLDVAADGTGRYYVAGNVMAGDDRVTQNNSEGVQDTAPSCLVEAPFPYEPIQEDTPWGAYERVLQLVGCSRARDAYDAEVLWQMSEDVAIWGNRGIINTPQQVGGWPVLKKGKRLKDSDRDGMPDEWESQRGLDADNACDASTFCLDHRYTNLEVYLNHLLR